MDDTEYLNSSENNKEVLQQSINSYKSVKGLKEQMENMSVEALKNLRLECDTLIKSKTI